MTAPNTVDSRTIGGVCYLAAADVARGLRARADQLEAAKPTSTELDELIRTEAHVHAVAYEAMIRELRQYADWIDLSVIEHLTEHPGDSSLDA